MTYPASLSVIRVYGTYLNADGTPATGYIVFTNQYTLTSPSNSTIVQLTDVSVDLDATGSFSVNLPASNDPDWFPNPAVWTVQENTSYRRQQVAYNVLVPYNAAGNQVALAALTPIPTVPVPNIYVLQSAVAAANGVASLDGTGNVPANQLGNVAGQSPSGTVVSETAFGQSAAAGTATAYSRGDHTHGTPAAPSIPSAASTVTTEQTFGQAPSAGAAATFSRGDHTHGTVLLSSTTPAQNQGAAAIGSGTTAAKADHNHGMASPVHTDFNLLGWTLPAWAVNTTATAPTPAGTVFFAKIFCPVAITVTKIWYNMATAQVGGTAGQNFFALYTGAGAFLQISDDQTTNWSTTGTKSGNFVSTALSAGTNIIAFFFNGSGAGPRFAAGMNGSLLSAAQSSPNFIFGNTADTARTTTFPANLTAPYAAYNSSVWFGLA